MATQEHGLVRYAGRTFRVVGSGDGLPTDNLYSLEFNTRGDFWLGSDAGLMRVRVDSIARHLADPANKLQVSLLDDADGLPAISLDPLGNQGSLRLPNGLLWFGIENGIAQFDPATLFQEPTPPHTVMEQHTIDGSALRNGPIILKPGQSNLELHYTALGSDKPEQLSFRYRLVGYDAHWIDAKGRRIAYYSHLSPGSYTFEVQSAETDGAEWNQAAEATATVRVLTPFYRTGWMKALVLLACLSAAGYGLLRRQRRAHREQLARQAFTHQLIATQEGERKRIAHELHDSLGQHLVLIRTLALLPTSPANTARGDHLAKIADQAAVAIQEVESISYDLRPYQLDRLGLTRTILSLIEAFQSSGPVNVTHSIENIDEFFPKDWEINFYRIVQEALGNILKHAEATEVTVTIARTSSALRLVVADNGQGFATSAGGSSSGGLGLIGIQERAEALGGHAVIQSADRSGTRIIVTVARTS